MKQPNEGKRESRAARVPEQGRRATVTFRCLPAVQAKVQEAAANSGRSVSEEIERRIEESFSGALSADLRTKGLFEAVAQMIFMVERATGSKWWETEIAASMSGDAIRELINSLMPKYDPPQNKLLALVESDKARAEREAKEALWRTTLEMNAMDRAIRILRGEQPTNNDTPASGKLSHPGKSSGTK